MASVDPADELADLVAEQLLNFVREARDQFRIEAEILVFLLAQPPGAIVERQPEARIARPVRTAAVPDGAVPHQHRTAPHLYCDRVGSGIDRCSAEVAARYQPRPAVGLAEIG